jgi:hypothetical protein
MLLGIPESEAAGISAEAALFLLGIAGGFHLIDRLIGASTGWMRYMGTAMRLNEQLMTFHYRWNELTAFPSSNPPTARPHLPLIDSPQTPPPPNPGSPISGQGEQDSSFKSVDQLKFELARNFCLAILSTAREETTSWAAEFSDSIAEFEKQLPLNPFPRGSGRP